MARKAKPFSAYDTISWLTAKTLLVPQAQLLEQYGRSLQEERRKTQQASAELLTASNGLGWSALAHMFVTRDHLRVPPGTINSILSPGYHPQHGVESPNMRWGSKPWF